MEGENIIFSYTGSVALPHDEKSIYLKPETFETARKTVGRHFEVYAVEYEWLEHWKKSGYPELKTPDGAFINFCKKRVEGL
ncbi:hypothetical protein [Bathymodiolus platifrons methanotrophic gill symbiont]|uniref:hypothetical protein n=1 Tax=Bathymodiolus platifrons methanotrophic gill symbiont TaxID=113268 RepID=UPI001124DC5D|nr:hypothetical protein [Bathymodiolus platifrons methanotrophic gill symbiont]